jgi:hypothetical protein
MFAIAFVSVTIVYILTSMSPEQYYTILQLIISFFAGFFTSRVLDLHFRPRVCARAASCWSIKRTTTS